MRAARLIFAVAGLYGLIVLLPLFFVEPWLSPPPSRPEDYYGFLGSATAFQLVYLTIARDPVRFRPLMPIAVLAKVAFFVAVAILWGQGRTAGPILVFATIDLTIGAAFLYAWRRLPPG
ncbi:MAG TPA: hypothetical protein VGW40_10750 [Allosphingosinicella sp.]|nr:hypothetical protein [Allosphingosinicella sp.]